VHVHQGKTDLFAQPDGLLSKTFTVFLKTAKALFGVATMNGLDRFRDSAVATITVNQGLSNARVSPFGGTGWKYVAMCP